MSRLSIIARASRRNRGRQRALRADGQTAAFLLERGVAVRQGLRFLRAELPIILATCRRA